MEQDYITRREHEEFARRMDSKNERIRDENERQNKRIAIVEESVSGIIGAVVGAVGAAIVARVIH